jgi:hypothetical protein
MDVTGTDIPVCLAQAMEQLELDFHSPNDPRPIPWTWAYKLTADALVEELGDRRFLFGLWNRLFGCWAIDPDTGRASEFVPSWPVLGRSGIWLTPEETSISRGFGVGCRMMSPQWHFEAKAACAAFFSSIPNRVRTLVGCFGQYQWLALDLIWQKPGFARFLDEEISQGREQYVFACFALADAVRLRRSERQELAEAIMYQKRAQLIGQLSGEECSGAMLKALNKLGDEPQDASVYASLIRSMADPRMAKVISHAEEIVPETLTLTSFPQEISVPVMAWMASNPGFGREHIGFLRDLFESLPEEDQSRVVQSLGHVETHEDFWEWAEKWEEHLFHITPFQSPPIQGGQALQPLRTPQAMRREAREMGNCLDALIEAVSNGERYFFHWAGSVPATVELRRDENSMWVAGEAFGRDNSELDQKTRRKLLDKLRPEGVRCESS